jgi:hypothetical protein
MAGHEARMRKVRNSIETLIKKSEGKKPLNRTRCRPKCEDNIKMDLKEIGYKYVDRIYLAL